MKLIDNYYRSEGEEAFLDFNNFSVYCHSLLKIEKILPRDFVRYFALDIIGRDEVRKLNWCVFGGLDINIIEELIACEIWPNLEVWNITFSKDRLGIFSFGQSYTENDNGLITAHICNNYLRLIVAERNNFGYGRNGCL